MRLVTGTWTRHDAIVRLKLLLILVLAARVASSAELIWVTPGGGIRATVSCMGFAHLFYRAGLISKESSAFHSVASNSGSSWFMIPFFYSSAFFGRILVDEPNLIRDVVNTWLTATTNSLPEPAEYPECAPLEALGKISPLLNAYYLQCNAFVPFEQDWAIYIKAVMNATLLAFGEDPDFVDRNMSPEKRVTALQMTDLLIQTGLAPTSKINDTLVTLGPKTSPNKVFSYFLMAQFVVKTNQTYFHYGEKEDDLPFAAQAFLASETFTRNDWQDYYLPFPPQNASLLTTVTPFEPASFNDTLWEFREPFGDQIPTVTQIAAASSAATSFLSPSAPLGMAHFQALVDFVIDFGLDLNPFLKGIIKTQVENAFNYIYQAPIFGGMSICTQWPEPCELNDSQFIDGGFVDPFALVQTLSNYQNSEAVDLSQAIKIIMTHHNWANETDTTVLGYFSTTFNQDIAPGDYLWPPNNSDILPASTNPTRSRQLFVEYFDQESWLNSSLPVSNGRFSTAIHTVTTIDNPVFGIKGGQTVELLYIRINSDFPREIDIVEYKEELADLAESLASNDELAERIEAFAV